MSANNNSGSARILIVDDQPANLQVLGTMLGKLDYEIVTASDGLTALKRLELRPPDLVLLDLMMPGMDGFEVCRRIRATSAHVELPVIFLSAVDEKGLIVRALECGGVDFITKPFNQAELIRRVQTHLALKAAGDRLRRLAEDKDELLGILAHDLKNALGSVLMSSQLLVERTEGDPGLHRLSTNILEATDRTLAFVKQFLANSAAEHGLDLVRAPLNFGALVGELVQQHFAAARRKQIRLQFELPPDELIVSTDAGALRQILDNLLSNAVKFSPPGKRIQVSVHARPETAECQVRDEGPGFTIEDRQRLFRRYCRLSARPTGGEPSTGLGLSIAHRLAGLLGGELLCESSPGDGATFTVRIPNN